MFSDITSTAWQKDSSGNMTRSLNYTITINNPLIGKFSAATENQVGLHSYEFYVDIIDPFRLTVTPYTSQTLHRDSRDGHFYLLDSEVYTHDVPYHDYFYTQNCYYIIRNSKLKCRLKWAILISSVSLIFKATANQNVCVALPGSTPMWDTRNSRGVQSSPSSLKTPGAA